MRSEVVLLNVLLGSLLCKIHGSCLQDLKNRDGKVLIDSLSHCPTRCVVDAILPASSSVSILLVTAATRASVTLTF